MSTATADAAALVDLLHPDGVATRVMVLGEACPPYLFTPDSRGTCDSTATAGADAVLIVPSRSQCRIPGWLEGAVDTADRTLAADGITYLIVARRWRQRAAQLLAARGLVVATALAHARQGSSSHYLVPCDAAVARHLGRHVQMGRSTSLAWRVGWALPGAASVVPRLAGDIGMLARRAGGRAHTSWLEPVCGAAHIAHTLIRIKTRGEARTAVMSVFAAGATAPHTLLKVPLSESSRRARRVEALALEHLGEAARRAGAVVPGGVLSSLPGRDDVLRLDPLEGVPESVLLSAEPQRYARVLETMTEWLLRWAQTTMRERYLDGARLDYEIHRPAAVVAPLLTDGAAYLEWLRAAGARCLGASLPTVATHGDLSMSNVLATGSHQLGVIDWEHARADGLPLTDFFYAAADATAAAHGYRDRTAAFVRSLDTGTPEGRQVTASTRRLASALGLADDVVQLLRHATALQHGANELHSGRTGHRPFVAMAQHLASRALEHSPVV